MTPIEVIKFAKEKNVKMVDLKFIDLPGMWQHFAIPLHQLSEETFEEGLGFDGFNFFHEIMQINYQRRFLLGRTKSYDAAYSNYLWN